MGVIGSKVDVVAESFERRGLKVHEQELHSGGVEALGFMLDGQPQQTRISSQRSWKVRGALLALARRQRVSGRQVEAVIYLLRSGTTGHLVGFLCVVCVYLRGW